MISMKQFHDQFIQRHEFEFEDSDFLSSKYNKILFQNIPQAWVCCIDNYLCNINTGNINSISQILGFPIIDCKNNISDSDFNVLKKLENKLQLIDIDLYKQIDAVVLN